MHILLNRIQLTQRYKLPNSLYENYKLPKLVYNYSMYVISQYPLLHRCRGLIYVRTLRIVI